LTCPAILATGSIVFVHRSLTDLRFLLISTNSLTLRLKSIRKVAIN